jgi:DNA-binding CsgD family transcriptional regulator
MTVVPIDQLRPVGQPRFGGVDALLANATAEVLVMSTRAAAIAEPIGAVRKIDLDNVRRGVRYRVLVPDPARTAPQVAAQLGALSLAGGTVRTVPDVPTDALVIDRRLAVMPSDRGRGIAAFQLPSVVTTTVELFERVWAGAAPLNPSALPESTELTVRERHLLSLLFSGSTDETAAAQLDISVRTVRRTVADIMNRLGARSRFQAGAKAAERGWLLDQAG